MVVLNRRDYYSTVYILLEIRKQLVHSYLSCRKIGSDGKAILTRYYLGYSLDLLRDSLNRLGVLDDQSAKIYFDLPIWNDENGMTPMFSFNMEKRKEQKAEFEETMKKYFKGYHFAIDLDSENLEFSYRDAKKIKIVLDKYKLPYSLKFSGGKGFHFLIEDKWFNPKLKAETKVKKFKKLADCITAIAKVKTAKSGGTYDDSIYDNRRIFKVAYSLNFKEGKEYVCLPLDDRQFENFKLEDMELPNVMNAVRISNRGLVTRSHGLNENQLRVNVKAFLKECNL